ncbi:MAG: transcription termination factor Rho [Eubacterium sp.]|nr:transcription termination factor Rho [Eubacterium sp.]
MTKEQYESLPLVELRALAKARGLKKTSALRKSELVTVMLDADKADQESVQPSKAAETAKGTEDTSKPKRGRKPARKTVNPTADEKAENTDSDEERKPEGKPNRKAVQRTSEKTELKTDVQSETKSESKTSRFVKKARAVNKRTGNTADGPVQQKSASTDEAEAPAVYTERKELPADDSRPIRRDNQNTRRPDSTDTRRQDSTDTRRQDVPDSRRQDNTESDNYASGILEVMPEGFGFIRSDNFLPGEDDVYVSPSQIRKFRLKTGDVLTGNTRMQSQTEKYSALLYLKTVNGEEPYKAAHRYNFEDMTPIFPNERIHLERPGGSVAMRIVDLVSPIGKGQRGMIVSPPKAGKTTLLKDCAKSILVNHPDMHVIILLIDERPEEVTDIKETVQGPNVEVIYSTFDETPEHHKRVSEMVIERAKRLVESQRDVIIFIDSITRLTRAYNQVVPPSGRTLTGGLDPAALHMPKRFFGAARNMREGGSLTILATALIDTGSKMDDVVYEEFKGTGNMELILNRKLQERRIFPAIDIAKSGTRRDDLLLTREEQDAMDHIRRALSGLKADEATESILNIFVRTRTNAETVRMLRTSRII